MFHMTYKEQLESRQWKELRQQVITRDQFKCQSCFNEVLLKDSVKELVKRKSLRDNENIDQFVSDSGKIGYAPKSVRYSQYYLGYFGLHGERNCLEALVSIDQKEFDFLTSTEAVKYVESSKITAKKFHSIRWLKNEQRKTRQEIAKLSNRRFPKQDLEQIELTPEEYDSYEQRRLTLNKDFLSVIRLHVHHEYYQAGKLAWEYPLEKLKTLCWICHQKEHENGLISVLDESGTSLKKYHYCTRCFGAGEFPEFGHVQNGICFNCLGAKYVELLHNTASY